MKKRDFKNGKQKMLNFFTLISNNIKNDIKENDLNLEDIATKAGISYEQAINALNLVNPNISLYYSLKKEIDNEKKKKL